MRAEDFVLEIGDTRLQFVVLHGAELDFDWGDFPLQGDDLAWVAMSCLMLPADHDAAFLFAGCLNTGMVN